MNNHQSNIFIKKAESKNLEAINILIYNSKAYWGYDEEFMKAFMQVFGVTRAYLERAEAQLFYVNNTLAGFYSFNTNQDNEIELDHLWLNPAFIGKGFGREIWNYGCESAKKLGLKEFNFWADPNAENFYLHMGCRRLRLQLSPIMKDRYIPIMNYSF